MDIGRNFVVACQTLKINMFKQKHLNSLNISSLIFGMTQVDRQNPTHPPAMEFSATITHQTNKKLIHRLCYETFTHRSMFLSHPPKKKKHPNLLWEKWNHSEHRLASVRGVVLMWVFVWGAGMPCLPPLRTPTELLPWH